MKDLEWIRPDGNFVSYDKDAEDVFVLFYDNGIADEFKTYADDFLEAANIIMKHLLDEAGPEHRIDKLDTWFFAVVYLYRQSLELILKAVLFKYCAKIEIKELIGKVRHDLSICYKEIEDILFRNEEIHTEEKIWLKSYLSDISQIDKESDLFRYPFTNEHEHNRSFQKQQNANLEIIKVNMNVAYSLINYLYLGDLTEKIVSVYEPKLLVDAGNYYCRSVFGYEYMSNDFHGYIKSYVECAEYLRRFICTDYNVNRRLFLPMNYLYRNGVELSLKKILIEDTKIDYKEKFKLLRKKKHSVMGLWNAIKEDVLKDSMGESEPDKVIHNAETYIVQLQGLDASSTLFRYPVDKQVQFHYKEGKRLNINNVAKCFNELCVFLDCIDSTMADHRDFEAEMRAEYEAEMRADYMANLEYDMY